MIVNVDGVGVTEWLAEASVTVWAEQSNSYLYSVVDVKADWSTAACAGVDPELWFQSTGGGDNMETPSCQPKAICSTCPIRLACLDYAIANTVEHGIWGGESVDARRAIAAGRKPYPHTVEPRPVVLPNMLHVDDEPSDVDGVVRNRDGSWSVRVPDARGHAGRTVKAATFDNKLSAENDALTRQGVAA